MKVLQKSKMEKKMENEFVDLKRNRQDISRLDWMENELFDPITGEYRFKCKCTEKKVVLSERKTHQLNIFPQNPIDNKNTMKNIDSETLNKVKIN